MGNVTRKDFYPAFNVSLGKTLAAAAWVDGDLNEEEMNCLKAIVLQLPYISFEDWRKLKIYLAYSFPLPDRYFGTAFCSKYVSKNCSIIFDNQSTIFLSLKFYIFNII